MGDFHHQIKLPDYLIDAKVRSRAARDKITFKAAQGQMLWEHEQEELPTEDEVTDKAAEILGELAGEFGFYGE